MALVAHLSRAGALACRPSMAKRCRVLIPVRAFKDSPKQDAPQQQHQKSDLPATQQQQESRLAARPERPLEVMPFRRMTEALQQMQNEMDAIMDHFGFDDFGFGRRSPFSLLAPFANAMPKVAGPISRLVPFDVKEEQDKYKVTVEVPGFTKKDIKVMLDPSTNTLTITGQKKETEGKESEQASSRAFSFTRSFSLPQDVDTNKGIKARTEHGLLTVDLPKSPESTPQMKEISVEGH